MEEYLSPTEYDTVNESVAQVKHLWGQGGTTHTVFQLQPLIQEAFWEVVGHTSETQS